MEKGRQNGSSLSYSITELCFYFIQAWSEWKSDVKRKLVQSKAESRATGGGPFSKFQLSTNEEAMIRVCGIAQAVEGVVGIAIGLPENVGAESEEVMPSTPKRRSLSPLLISSTPKSLNRNPWRAIKKVSRRRQ